MASGRNPGHTGVLDQRFAAFPQSQLLQTTFYDQVRIIWMNRGVLLSMQHAGRVTRSLLVWFVAFGVRPPKAAKACGIRFAKPVASPEWTPMPAKSSACSSASNRAIAPPADIPAAVNLLTQVRCRSIYWLESSKVTVMIQSGSP
jgi:hypothetical protein